jgi:hypothetical protein
MSNPTAWRPARGKRGLLALIILGFIARITLSSISHGSDDAKIWWWFGKRIAADGLAKQYANEPAYNIPAIPQFNHPPIPAYWAMIAYDLTRWSKYTPEQDAAAAFPFVFRIPDILADLLSCWLLLKIGTRRAGPRAESQSDPRDDPASTPSADAHSTPRVDAHSIPRADAHSDPRTDAHSTPRDDPHLSLRASPQRTPRAGFILAIAFAWSPLAILTSAHHGSTDSIYAALCLLAAYCAADLDAPCWAGLALGAAINVKLIPVFVIVPMLLLFRSWRDASKFITGLAIMTIPFIPVMIFSGRDFIRYAVAYSSVKDYWGIDQFLLETAHQPKFARIGWDLLSFYSAIGRYLLAAAVIAFAIIARYRRLNFYQAAAGAASLFLILAPGFGVQYLIFALPVLLAANFPAGVRYSLLGGAFLFIAYALFWNNKLPIQTYGISGEVPRGPGALFALLAWAGLVSFVWKLTSSKPEKSRT